MSDTNTLETLYRIGELVNRTEDPREALDLILDEIVTTLGASSASIALLNPDNGTLRIEVQRGLPRPATGHELKPGIGITGWVVLHGKPVLVPDVTKDARYLALRDDVKSELAVPLELGGRVIGVVNCDSDRAGAFGEKDLGLLTRITAEAAKTVRRLWLVRRLNTINARQESLVEAARDLVRERAAPAVLRDLARRGHELFTGAAFVVYTLDGDTLTPAAVEGDLRGSELSPSVETGDTSLGSAVTRRKAVSVENAGRSEENLFSKLTPEFHATSILAAPVVFEEETLGLVALFSGTPHRFSDDDRRLIGTLASLGAAALRNAHLYARVFAVEENLREHERLTTLGLIAAEIAHEVRNPLTVIRLLFDSLGIDFAEGDPRKEDLRVIGDKLGHLESIVTRVLEFGRRRAVDDEKFDLGNEAADTLLLMRMKFESTRVAATFERPETALPVAGNRGEIRQALLNLLLNAIQAMPGGGEISVSITVESGAEGRLGVIRVADNGPGIPEAIRDRLFESFLTSRSEGTGLGLSIVKRILRGHEGDIVVEKSDATGTTFRLTVPLAE